MNYKSLVVLIRIDARSEPSYEFTEQFESAVGRFLPIACR